MPVTLFSPSSPSSSAPAAKPSAAALSALSETDFVAALDGIFEHSPWVARRAWPRRPFAHREALAQALEEAMLDASMEEKLALIRAHPELAGKAAVAGTLTRESTQEQGGAGLNACTPEEFARLQELNGIYGARFGHPFIVAVRGCTRQQIIEIFERRVRNTPHEEMEESLRQIARIARLRLEDRVGS